MDPTILDWIIVIAFLSLCFGVVAVFQIRNTLESVYETLVHLNEAVNELRGITKSERDAHE